MVLGHVTCFGHWNVSGCNVSRGLKIPCSVALLLYYSDLRWENISQGADAFFFLIYLWLCWVFVSVRGLSPVVASGGHSSSRCAGLSLSRPLPLRSTGSTRAGSATVAHGPIRFAACGIFPDQGSNPCSLHWQADPQPLRHQGSPSWCIFNVGPVTNTWITYLS